MAHASFHCDVCYNPYDYYEHIPLILSCGHTFCRSCLLDCGMRSPHCPSCRKHFLDVDQLPRNYAMLAAMDAYQHDVVQLLERHGLSEGVRLLVPAEDVQLHHMLSTEGREYGNVWKGVFRGKHVAVKTVELQPGHQELPDSAKREVRVLLQTSVEGCRHVVKCLGITAKDGQLCIVMKLYDRSLRQSIGRSWGNPGGGLPYTTALRYALDISKAMMELHDLGVIICDLKPDNVLIDTATDEAVLTDFGISRIVPAAMEGCRASTVQGTVPYMAPEQFEPEVHPGVTNKADTWGFGATLLHMLTGTMPWPGWHWERIRQAVRDNKEAPPVPENLPHGARQLLYSCFEGEPQRRPSPCEIYKDLLQLLSPSAPQLPEFAMDPGGNAPVAGLEQYVNSVFNSLQTALNDYTRDVHTLRTDFSRHSAQLSDLSCKMTEVRAAIDKLTVGGAAFSQRPQAQSICTGRMADTIVDLRLGIPMTGDPELDQKIGCHIDGQGASTRICCDNGRQLAPGVGWPLAAAVLLSPPLTRIELTDAIHALGDDGCRALAEALVACPPLRHLKLDGCGVGCVGANLLARSLRHNTNLRELLLPRNNVGPEGVTSFASILSRNPHLTHLALNRNNLTSAAPLLPLLEAPTCRLAALSLSGNPLEDWAPLGAALALNASLTSLQLDYCDMTAAGAAALCDGLTANTTLVALNLSFNKPFGLEGAVAVGWVLEASPSLAELSLKGVALMDEGAAALAAAMARSAALTGLMLDGNGINERGAKALAEGVRGCHALATLCVFDNQMWDKGVKLVALAAAECQSLRALDLRNNKVSRPIAKWLKGALPPRVKLQVGG